MAEAGPPAAVPNGSDPKGLDSGGEGGAETGSEASSVGGCGQG